MALAVAKLGGHSISPRRPHGSWITASGSRWAWDRVTSCPGRLRRMKPSSVARRETCARTSGPRRLRAQAARIKPPSWDFFRALVLTFRRQRLAVDTGRAIDPQTAVPVPVTHPPAQLSAKGTAEAVGLESLHLGDNVVAPE